MGYQKSQMDIPQAGLRQDRGQKAFCLLHSPISVNDCGCEAFRTVSLCQGFLPDFWNTSLSWFPSSLPGCSFSVYLLSSSPSRYYVSKCLRSGPSCTLHTYPLWVIRFQPMALSVISMLRRSNFYLEPGCPHEWQSRIAQQFHMDH